MKLLDKHLKKIKGEEKNAGMLSQLVQEISKDSIAAPNNNLSFYSWMSCGLWEFNTKL